MATSHGYLKEIGAEPVNAASATLTPPEDKAQPSKGKSGREERLRSWFVDDII